MKRSIVAAILVSAGIALSGTAALTHEHATGVVKERMDAMKEMGKRLKAINERARAGRELGSVGTDAKAIAERASHIVHMFPPGSADPPSQARKSIWQTGSEFEKLADALQAASTKLASANAADVSAIRTEAKAVTQACTACHEKYRVRR